MDRYGLFSFGALAYGVPLGRLRKVVHQQAGYQLPKLPTVVDEVLVVGGHLVPLLSLENMTHAATRSARSAEYKILADSEGGVVAFPASLVGGVVAEQKGVFLASEAGQSSGEVGTFAYQGKSYKILDIDFLALEMTLRSDETV